MNSLIKKYTHGLNVLNDTDAAQEIFRRGAHERASKISAIVQPESIGTIAVFSDQERHPGKIVEVVSSLDGEDACMTLYMENPIFGELTKLAELRKEVICAIGSRFVSLPGLMTVMDEARGKKVLLREMGTAQLLDLLADYTN